MTVTSGAADTAGEPTGPAMDADALLAGHRIVVCCGAGGVGKTTVAAALGLRAAERGRRVVVLTIDPARRLAQAMGLTELDNTPRRVTGIDEGAGGELHAMMLDMKRTFDDIVVAHAEPARAEQILTNRFYQALSSSFAGTQEYMAMEKLAALQASGGWDLIVVDTPPSRSALDFLDAPARLGAFLDGRLVRMLLAPARTGGRAYVRAFSAGVGVLTGVLDKIVGAQLLRDLQTFVAAMESMFGGFRQRAESTYELLKAPGTAFVVVAAPERDAIREASYFVERLYAESMPLAGLVVNRVHRTDAPALGVERSLAAAESLEEAAEGASEGAGEGAAAEVSKESTRPLTASVLRLHAERVALVHRDGRLIDRFTGAHPSVAVARAAARPGDIGDLAGLRALAAELARRPRHSGGG